MARVLRWLSIPVRGNWEWTLVVALAVLFVIAAIGGGFSDGGDYLASWWDGP